MQLVQTCVELSVVKTYWNSNPASVTAKRPNIQVKPNRGLKIINAFKVFLKGIKCKTAFKLQFPFGAILCNIDFAWNKVTSFELFVNCN